MAQHPEQQQPTLEEETPPSALLLLPNDVWEHILGRTDPRDICSLACSAPCCLRLAGRARRAVQLARHYGRLQLLAVRHGMEARDEFVSRKICNRRLMSREASQAQILNLLQVRECCGCQLKLAALPTLTHTNPALSSAAACLVTAALAGPHPRPGRCHTAESGPHHIPGLPVPHTVSPHQGRPGPLRQLRVCAGLEAAHEEGARQANGCTTGCRSCCYRWWSCSSSSAGCGGS